ncbi:hypothetical protein [Pseudomonas pudica]|uniref:RelA/SpoT domain-containing protein n=1 Tax=Pseudomonas pudica TaxID=272772 RepID=A0ABS0G813_9PSED|nr:hypothetical protein [Pseudomonas pudica]MBF8648765.1 hypothetical protein [Pseudomonas pudica]MBF8763174.1 hypothetical protein [Pseudomonas pudica]
MKIVKVVRDLYFEIRPNYEKLSEEVSSNLKRICENHNWFYISRIKEIESFALKIETGRVENPGAMEDFFACTLVVPTLSDIDKAENLVLEHYDSAYRRPKDDSHTSKPASSFAFDDLRLYVKRRSLASGRQPELDGMIFEVQIKTVLQHAWSVATHDLIYKSDTVNWPLERIAFQVKAMLEHAEIAIAEADRLSNSSAVAKRDKRAIEILALIESINKIWGKDKVPADVKRLAENIHSVLCTCNIAVDDFPNIISAERKRLGLLPADLSPYAFFVQALARHGEADLERKLKKSHKQKIVIHSGMDLPDWMSENNSKLINLG